MGCIVGSMMIALSEPTALHPVSGAFIHYSARFGDPAVGFALRWVRLMVLYAITLSTETTPLPSSSSSGAMTSTSPFESARSWFSIIKIIILPTELETPLISEMITEQEVPGYERQREYIMGALGSRDDYSIGLWREWFRNLANLLRPLWRSLGRGLRRAVIKDLSDLCADIFLAEGKGDRGKYDKPPSLNLFPALKTVENMKANERLKSLAHGRVRLSPRQQSNYGMRYAGNAGF
ncbi:hypothetical protein JCM5296_002806 [Sporobolomyces johnsonii]